MNKAQVVRVDVEGTGVRMRLWIDDEAGHHVTVCELRLGIKSLAAWALEVNDALQKEGQEQLPYE